MALLGKNKLKADQFKKDLEKFLMTENRDEAVEALYDALENRFFEMEYGEPTVSKNYMTKDARQYYEELADKLRAKQLTKPGDIPMPESEVEKVLDNMKTESKILDSINVVSNTYLTKVITNGKAVQKGAWGDLTEAVVTELLGAFKVVELEESKVSCFGEVSTDMIEVGPQYLAEHMNATLTEGLVATIEDAIVSGTGKKMPIGLDRDLAGTVTDGVYPRKTKIVVTDFNTDTYATLIDKLSKDANGRSKRFDKVQLLVNQHTYLTKVMPATTLLGISGAYIKDIFPFPTEVMITEGLADDEAVLCLLGEYVGVVGKQIQITYSDDFKFLEDLRCFKGKAFMTGRPVDNTSAVLLDISGLKKLVPGVSVDGVVATKEQA